MFKSPPALNTHASSRLRKVRNKNCH